MGDDHPDLAGHRARLRQRFLETGLNGFLDHEVVEFLLTLGTPRRDCKPAARELLRRFKTLPAVLEASLSELTDVDGVGPTNALPLKLVKAAADRYLEHQIRGLAVLASPKAVFDYLYMSLREKDREVFKILYLDAKNRVMAVEDLFEGSLTASPVYPREVVRGVLAHKAAAVIFAHNHPSGDPAPSREDVAITRRLVHALSTVGVRVHEHLVIGDNCYHSFAEAGLIAALQAEVAKAENAFMREWDHDRGSGGDPS